MISYSAIIDLFKKALSEEWGYIWGTAGETWTQSKQNDAVNQYNKAVDNNDQKGIDRWEMAAKYGQKWIGKHVADCSGLFAWAFKQKNGYMPHGSNSIWKGYLSNKGDLKSGKRTDGKQLLPGTAVFKVRNGSDYYHIGLYVGDNKVIEAQGTKAGVTTSKISAWHAWGEMKNVSYAEKEAIPVSEPIKYQNAVVNANGGVNLRATPSKSAMRITTIPGGAVVEAAQYDDEWSKVKYNGREGYAMSEFLSFNGEDNTGSEIFALINNIESDLKKLKALLQA